MISSLHEDINNDIICATNALNLTTKENYWYYLSLKGMKSQVRMLAKNEGENSYTKRINSMCKISQA